MTAFPKSILTILTLTKMTRKSHPKVCTESHQKNGTSMGKSHSGKFFPQYLSIRYRTHITLLCAHQDRVSLHRHEVQRRGTRQVGAALGGTGEGWSKTSGGWCEMCIWKCYLLHMLIPMTKPLPWFRALVLTLTICNIFMIEVIDSEYTQESAYETNWKHNSSNNKINGSLEKNQGGNEMLPPFKKLK